MCPLEAHPDRNDQTLPNRRLLGLKEGTHYPASATSSAVEVHQLLQPFLEQHWAATF
jgi:hypothetical protein